MKKKNSLNAQTNGTSNNHIPDIEIIDLELDGNTDNSEPEEITPKENMDTELFPEEALPEDEQPDEPSNTSKKGIRSFMNIHMLLLVVFVVFVLAIIAKFNNWGIFVDLSEIESDHSIGYLDVLDQFLPLMDAEGKRVPTGDAENIVVFGNAPFADDRGSEDNLANLIAEASGAKVYNCSISNSYLASKDYYYDSKTVPMDAYCFYWLVTLATYGSNTHYYSDAVRDLGDAIPPEAQEVYDTLTTLDFNTVDVIAIMYDASDYLMGHEMYDDANPTNIQTFTGNLEAGIEMIQANYPHIRIIVLSPTYAYAIDEEGEYVSSDMYRYGQDVLSTYVIKQCEASASRSVSFVDNLYGTVTESNAQEYLVDHIHLNVEGRKLVAKRFMEALTAFSKD